MWKLAAVALVVASLSSPALSQSQGLDGVNFVKAVRESDGDTALPLVTSRPNVVNARDDRGDTPLTITVARRDSTWTFFLLDKGANPDLANRSGDTPLIIAARVGYMEGAQELLAQGAKVDLANKMGETPLIIAVQQRQRDIAKLLLENGADPDKTDNAGGYSAREYAKRDSRSRDILTLIESAKKAGTPVKKVEKAEDFRL
jgi:ankyrin repeat protein